MTSRLLVQRRRVPGLRLLAVVAVLGVGVLAAFVVPGLTAAGIVGLASVVDVPPLLALLAAVVAYVPLASVVAYALARALERSAELRVPWGLVAIGAEGVRWDGWVRRNLTPWRDVRAILTEGDAVVLVTHAGARIVLAASEPAFLREAVRAARAAYESTRRAEIPDVLRGEGETERWITRARARRAGGSYRDADVPTRVLARVLEDPDAPALARVGAAAGLLPADHGQRARVQRVRDESVDDDFARVLDDLLDERFERARWARLARRA